MDATSSALQVLTAMITPSVLISACGTLAFSTSSRLGRVVDRTRSLFAELEHSADGTPGRPPMPHPKRALVLDQLSQLSRRVILLRRSITCFYVAIGLFVTTSITVGLSALGDWRYAWVPVVFELIGSGVLLFGSLLLISEARFAVTTTLGEMTYIREHITRHLTETRPGI